MPTTVRAGELFGLASSNTSFYVFICHFNGNVLLMFLVVMGKDAAAAAAERKGDGGGVMVCSKWHTQYGQ